MKKLLMILALMPLAALAQQGTSFKIDGKIKNLAYKPDWVFLQYFANGEWKKDSVQPTKEKYTFSGKLAEPTLARIFVKYVSADPAQKIAFSNKRDLASLFLEGSKITVTSVDSFSNIKVSGSKSHDEYAKLVKQEEPFDKRMEPLIEQYTAFGKAKDRVNQSKVEEQIDAIDNEKREKVYGEYAKNNSGSPIALYALRQYAGWDINADEVEPLFNRLPASVQQYPSAIELKEAVDIAKKTGIGKMAMEFSQNDTLDNPVKLSSFKGHYVLVDFWASWCGPCRAENPNVVKVYNKYKDKNFSILSVSLDRPGQKERWLKAIHDDGLTWTHVSDLKFWDNEVAKLYGIKAIPQNLLLDPEGKIIGKNLQGDELDQKVGEAVDGSKKSF